MPKYRFPELIGIPPSETPEGLVSLGGDLSVETLMEAYRRGIFPWPICPQESSTSDLGELPMTWFSPSPRAILELSELHISKTLKKAQKICDFRFTVDEAFQQVIESCARAKRPLQSGTWITEEMNQAYIRLHLAGFAHSIEVWEGSELVGGIYGVDIDGAFAGESMFYQKPNASKLAILFLMNRLHDRGLDWMDIQMLTPHMAALGAREVSRDEFLGKLAATRARGLKLF